MRYIFGFLIGIGMIVLTFILIFRIFGGSHDKNAPKPIDLNSYSTTDTVMRLSIDGPIVANQKHEQLRITIGRDEVLFERYTGYQGDLAASKSYPNNSDSYTQFLHALNNAGYTKGNKDAKVKDERGFCPLGRRYVYEAIGDGQDILRWWSTTCGKEGNFQGNGSDVRRLFIRQVTDYNQLVRGTTLD